MHSTVRSIPVFLSTVNLSNVYLSTYLPFPVSIFLFTCYFLPNYRLCVLFIVYCLDLLSTEHCILSFVYSLCLLSIIYFITIHCLLCSVCCLLSIVYCYQAQPKPKLSWSCLRLALFPFDPATHPHPQEKFQLKQKASRKALVISMV